MRWQPFAVTAALLAPPVVLAVAVWPEDGIAIGGGGDDVEAELAEGDSDTSATNGFSTTDFLIVGPGQLRISVTGPEFDPTITIVDPDTGAQLAYNDDFEGLNPSLVVDLDDGESVRAQVGSLGGPPGGPFEITVEATEDAPDEGGAIVGGGDDGFFGAPELPVVVLGDLGVGDVVDGSTGIDEVAAFLITGPGEFQLDVAADIDTTLRVVDDASGEQLAFNDDSGGGSDPSLVVVLVDGDVARVEVGVFGGGPGGDFSIQVADPAQSATTVVG